MRFQITLFLLIILSINNIAQEKSKYSFEKKIIGTAEAGLTITNSDYEDFGIDYQFRFSGEYFFYKTNNHYMGAKAFAGIGYLSGKSINKNPDNFKTDLYYLGLAGLYSYNFHERYFPFVSIGFSYVWFDPKDSGGKKLPNNSEKKYDLTAVNFNLEAGLKYFIDPSWTINISGMLHIHPNDWLDDYDSGNTDLFGSLLIGTSYLLSIGGVENNVSEKVIPIGITAVPLDSDNDGIVDENDKCPNTINGIEVDESGCPLDSDKDGVPDFVDKCSGTPMDVMVDSTGCPFDTDQDGIPDYRDKCPSTAFGEIVDTIGCPIVKEVKIKSKMTLEFASNSSRIKRIDYLTLDEFFNQISADSKSRWLIEGHTDSEEELIPEKSLSLERANFIKNYFVRKGIEANRIEVKAFGDLFPLGDNKTAEGRKENRRVEIKKLR